VEKIHGYKNDCILYRGHEYEDLEKYPICGLDWFNHRKDGGDKENCNRNIRKGGPIKLFWYFPIIPRWWHKGKHEQDAGMIRHLADATQWQDINLWNPEFANDPRNIRIAISTNGMNPFMNSSTHSTWPIVLTILNLPPWLYNKRNYSMMSGLILRPQQPGNDIDTYFSPIIEDLKELWYNNRVQV
jgi:hypothetical protein